MISKNLLLILSQSKYLSELNQHCPLMKLYIQRTNLKITWRTLTFYWHRFYSGQRIWMAEFTLYSLNLVLCFLLSCSNLFFLNVLFICRIFFLRFIDLFKSQSFFYGELSVLELFLMVLRSCAYKIHSCPNVSNIFVPEYLKE